MTSSLLDVVSLSVQFSCSLVSDSATPWTAAHQASLSITSSWSSLKLMSVIPSNHLILSHPLFFLPSIFPSIRVFSDESALHIRWPNYWNFSFNISPSSEYSGLISFRMDWLDLLAVQGTLKSLLQHHNSKTSILRCSAFFIVQLSHLYMTSGKTIALTTWTFVGRVMSLLFNMLSRLVITFLPRSQFFASGGQSIGVSASASVLPMKNQDSFPVGWTGCISLLSKGLSRIFSNTAVQKHQFFSAQLSLWSNSHIHT